MSTYSTRTQLKVVEEGGCLNVSFPAGTLLTESNVEEFGQDVTALMEGQDRPHLVLDLSGVAMLSSVALAKFVNLNGKLRESGGRLTLLNPTPSVRQIFKVTRLDTILEIPA